MEKCGQYRAKYGATPIWHNRYGLIWLDLSNKKIITYDPISKQENIYDALGMLRALIPTDDDQFIGVYKEGLYYLNFTQGTKNIFWAPSNSGDMYYLNDGICAANNKLWIGTGDRFFERFRDSAHTAMTKYPFENAQLFSVTDYGEIAVERENISFSSGLAWNSKTNKMYHIDSAKHTIFEYDLKNDGKIAKQKMIYTFPYEEGFPTGLTLDEEGNMWIALYKSNAITTKSNKATRLVCVDPIKSQIIREMELPISHITSCVIGGPDLKTLYITTAYELLPEAIVRQDPLAGYLIQVPLDIKGLEGNVFSINKPNKQQGFFNKI